MIHRKPSVLSRQAGNLAITHQSSRSAAHDRATSRSLRRCNRASGLKGTVALTRVSCPTLQAGQTVPRRPARDSRPSHPILPGHLASRGFRGLAGCSRWQPCFMQACGRWCSCCPTAGRITIPTPESRWRRRPPSSTCSLCSRLGRRSLPTGWTGALRGSCRRGQDLARAQASPRTPSSGPGGQLPRARHGHRHTVEAVRRRRPRLPVPVRGQCANGALAARTTPASS